MFCVLGSCSGFPFGVPGSGFQVPGSVSVTGHRRNEPRTTNPNKEHELSTQNPEPRTTSEANLRRWILRLHVDAVDETDPVRMRLHDERGRADAVAEEADALHQRAI